MRSVRSTLLAGIALTVGYAVYPALAQQSPTIVLAQADDIAARLAAAEAAVAAAEEALAEAEANGGDVEAAQAQLAAAQAELAEAQQATAAAEPEPEPESQATEAEPQTDEPEAQAAEEEPPPAEPEAQAAEEEPPPAEPEQAEQTPPVPEPAPDGDDVTTEEAEAPPAEEVAPVEDEAEPVEAVAAPEEATESTDTMSAEEESAPTEAVEEPETEQAADTEDVEPPTQQAEQPPAPEETEAESAEVAPQPEATDEESVVEEQLEAQGDDEGARTFRDLRQKFRQQQEAVEEQQAEEDQQTAEERSSDEDGDDRQARRDRNRDRDGDRPRRDAPPDTDVVEDFGTRFILRLGESLLIQQDEQTAGERFLYGARDVDVENLRGGRTRTTITRPNGVQIVTVRDRFGAIIIRTRVDHRGREIVLIDNRDFYDGDDGRRPRYRFNNDLPPLRVDIPQDQYIVDTRRADRRQIREALMAPPVEQVERPYALQEVLASDRLRDKMRRIDLSTITFDFGSAAIDPSQFQELTEVGRAMEDVLQDRPEEVFLIEGHTDAIGTDYANLLLSDRRAEAVAVALSSNFDIPPENLITQGYGEQFLKVPTTEAERENRRVAVLRITDLVRSASN